MSEWKEYKISEVIDEISMGPFGSNIKVDNFIDSGVPVLNGSNLQGFKLNEVSFNYVSQEKADSLGKANAHRGDVVITHRGTLGQIVYIPEDSNYEQYVISQSQFRLKLKKELIRPDFLVYFFHTRIGQHRIMMNASQVGVPALARPTSTFKEVFVPVPPLKIQNEVMAILSSLDDKIAVNRRICENLEAQAQALFKNWFVDFAPFKNGKFVESELGLIPEGWRVGTLGDLVEIIDNRGKTPPLCSESIYPIIDVKTLTGEGRIVSYEKCSKFVNQDTYNNWFRSGHPQKGDILLSTVGSLAEMKIFMGGLGCIAQNVVALRNPQKSLYLYDYLNWIKKDLLSYNIGSVQPSIKVTHIIKHKVLIPDQNILLRYQDIVKEITEKSYSNNAEITLLSNIRDTLLPKLMSGEIKIKYYA